MFPMLWQLRFNHSQQPRVGEQIEKMDGIDFLSAFGKMTFAVGQLDS